MKGFLWAIATFAATIVSRVQADGVCYDPNHGVAVTAGQIAADMNAIKSKGFSHVRTYVSKYGNIDLAGIVASSGLRVALGVPYGGDPDWQSHIQYAVNAAKKGSVDYILLGNENLGIAGAVPGDMVAAIKSIKSQVPNVQVGTVQRVVELRSNYPGIADLVAACDVVGVNIHPFFNPNTAINNAIGVSENQWRQVINSGIPGIGGKLILGETGWPSSGVYAGSVGSVAAAQAYFAAYKASSVFGGLGNNRKFYFQMFDTPYKGVEYESHYGIVNTDASAKFSASGSFSISVSISTPTPTTPAPTTPAPTTPAPTTTAPATPTATNGTTSGSQLAAFESLVNSQSSGSTTGGAGSTAGSTTTSESETGTTEGTNEAAVNELLAGAATTSGSTTSTGTKSTSSGSAEAAGKATETNTQSAGNTGSIGGIVVVAAFGCAAIGAAFAFIYKARQKAAELEASERKSVGSFAMTPGGACVL